MKLNRVHALIVIFVFSKISFLSTLQTRFGSFRVLHKHPGVRKCAVAALTQNDLVGGRVSDVAGVCEGLQHSWDKKMHSGYAYFTKIDVQEYYDPPVKLSITSDSYTWPLPGVLNVGTKVEVNLEVSEPSTYGFSIRLGDMWNWSMILYYGSMSYDPMVLLGLSEWVGPTTNVSEEWTQVKSNDVEKKNFSFQIHTNMLKVDMNNETIATYSRDGFDMTIATEVAVNSEERDGLVFLHSFKFHS